jgi:hypothetical protein
MLPFSSIGLALSLGRQKSQVGVSKRPHFGHSIHPVSWAGTPVDIVAESSSVGSLGGKLSFGAFSARS